MIIEMRTYKTKAGMRSRLIETIRTKSIPAHSEIGMIILGPFLSVEDPEYIFLYARLPGPCFARTDEGKVLRRGAFGARAGEPPDGNVGEV
jgi:hypothetical protein